MWRDAGDLGRVVVRRLEVPWQQFGDAVDRMIGDACEDFAQKCFELEAVELRALAQTVKRRGTYRDATKSGNEYGGVVASDANGRLHPRTALLKDKRPARARSERKNASVNSHGLS